MCCKTVPGFEELLRADLRTFFDKGGDLDAMLPADMFALLVGEPLSKVPAPEHKCVICIDALDELPRDDVGAVLKLFTDSFSKLPRWVGILVTSRGEAHIKAALSKKFTPMELKVDETRNQGDMRVFLRHIARGKFNDTSLSLADVELAIQKEFSGIVMVGKLAPLEPLLLASKGVYNGVMPEIVRQPKYDVLVKIPDLRPVPPLLQSSTSFDALFIEAAVAQEAVKATIAVLWEAAAGSNVRHPTSGKQDWVESADDPGIKGLERSLEKMKKDYDGKFQRLTDIARLTMRFTSPARLVRAFMEMQSLPQLKLVQVKNRFGSRTPLGYADLNVLYKVLIREGVSHYVEVRYFDMAARRESAKRPRYTSGAIQPRRDRAGEGYGAQVLREGAVGNPEDLRGHGARGGRARGVHHETPRQLGAGRRRRLARPQGRRPLHLRAAPR
jgi:hypothetical protein